MTLEERVVIMTVDSALALLAAEIMELQKIQTVCVTRIRQIAVQVEELRTHEALKNILDTLRKQDKRITVLEKVTT